MHVGRMYTYAHKDAAYLNAIHNKIAYDEGNWQDLFIQWNRSTGM